MKKHSFLFRSFITLFAIPCFTAKLAWAEVAGHFQFVTGNVVVEAVNGDARVAIKGAAVEENDTIKVGEKSAAQIRMIDEALLAIRANSSLRIDSYHQSNNAPSEERSFLSLIKGGFRAITGAIGKQNKENYKITTPSATIGIRGTDHEVWYLTEPWHELKVGTYNKVNTGGTIMNGTAINPNQAAYASNINQPAVILNYTPAIFITESEAANKEQSVQEQDNTNNEHAAIQNETALDQLNNINNQTPSSGNSGGSGNSGNSGGSGGSGGENNAPAGSATLGAISSATQLAIIGTTVGDSNKVQLNTSNIPEKISQPNTDFYAGTGTLINNGEKNLANTSINWGRYEDGGTVDFHNGNTIQNSASNWIYSNNSMSPDEASSYFQKYSHEFKLIENVGNITDHAGNNYQATGSLTVNTNNNPAVNMSITATNPQTTWALNYNGSLTQFYPSACAEQSCGLTLTEGSYTQGDKSSQSLKGTAFGVFIPPNAIGAISGFNAQAQNKDGTFINSLSGTAAFKK